LRANASRRRRRLVAYRLSERVQGGATVRRHFAPRCCTNPTPAAPLRRSAYSFVPAARGAPRRLSRGVIRPGAHSRFNAAGRRFAAAGNGLD